MRQVHFAAAIKGSEYTVFYSEEGCNPISLYPEGSCTTAVWAYDSEKPAAVGRVIPEEYQSDHVFYGQVDYGRLNEYTRGGRWYLTYGGDGVSSRFLSGLAADVERRLPRFWKKDENGNDLYERHWIFSVPGDLSEEQGVRYREQVGIYGETVKEAEALEAWRRGQETDGAEISSADAGDGAETNSTDVGNRAEAGSTETEEQPWSSRKPLENIARGLLIMASEKWPVTFRDSVEETARMFREAFDDMLGAQILKKRRWEYKFEPELYSLCCDAYRLTAEKTADAVYEQVMKVLEEAVWEWGISDITFRRGVAKKAKEQMHQWLNQPVLDASYDQITDAVCRIIKRVAVMLSDLPGMPRNEKIRLDPMRLDGALMTVFFRFFCPRDPRNTDGSSRGEKIIFEGIDWYVREKLRYTTRKTAVGDYWKSFCEISIRHHIREELVFGLTNEELAEKCIDQTYLNLLRELKKEEERLCGLIRRPEQQAEEKRKYETDTHCNDFPE